MNTENVIRSWEKLLTPEILRQNLINTSLYVLAFEILTTSIIKRIEDFFTFVNVDGKFVLSQEYKNVLALDKSKLQSSCLWLQQNGAITSDDIEKVSIIRQHRNEIAHEITDILSNAERHIAVQNFEDMRYLLEKIETWWIREVEVSINPEFDGIDIANADIQPGSVIMLNAIISASLKEC